MNQKQVLDKKFHTQFNFTQQEDNNRIRKFQKRN